MPQAHWFSLSKTPFLARSSHCIAASKSGIVIVYGGQLKPGTPIDSGTKFDGTPKGSLHIFDLAKSLLSQGWRMLTPDTKNISGDAAKAIPEPRTGAVTVWDGDALYLWGGRGGVDMAPLDAYQAGVWKATINLGQGTQQSVRWERIAATNEDEAPVPRSHHSAVAHGVRPLFMKTRGGMLMTYRVTCIFTLDVLRMVISVPCTRSISRTIHGRPSRQPRNLDAAAPP